MYTSTHIPLHPHPNTRTGVTSYTLLGQLLYRPVNPVVPAITELTPTLASLAYFIRPTMYDSVPALPGASTQGAHDACRYAYRVNAAFLAFQFVILAANVLNFGVQSTWVSLLSAIRFMHACGGGSPSDVLLTTIPPSHETQRPSPPNTVYAALRLRKTPTRREPYLLVWHKPALVLAALAVACYVTTIAAKEDAALQTLFLLRKVGHAYLFPFVRPALDTVGLFMLLTVASIVYGSCKQEPESFKVGACVRERGEETGSFSLINLPPPPSTKNDKNTVGGLYGLCPRLAVLPHHHRQLPGPFCGCVCVFAGHNGAHHAHNHKPQNH